jgi:hypothetical protein
MSKKRRIEELEQRVDVLAAQLRALNAPYAIFNTVELEWMYFEKKKPQKKQIGTAFYGNGYILKPQEEKEDAVKRVRKQRDEWN